MSSLPLVVVCVGTYRRNESLGVLLESVVAASSLVADRARVGVVLVDDNPDGRADVVAERFRDRFAAGLEYLQVGKGNISLVRNRAIDGALGWGADWIAMTDDDCVVPADWLAAYLDAADRTGGDGFTSGCQLVAPPGAPAWLTDEPFLRYDVWRFSAGAIVRVGATNNSFVRADWLRRHPDQRFDPALGVVGGEDMMFFRSAIARGLVVRFVPAAEVAGRETPERATLRYQLRARYWYGNTRFVTSHRLGETTRLRSAARGLELVFRGVRRALTRLIRGTSPQWRFSLSVSCEGLGMLAGVFGIEVAHH